MSVQTSSILSDATDAPREKEALIQSQDKPAQAPKQKRNEQTNVSPHLWSRIAVPVTCIVYILSLIVRIYAIKFDAYMNRSEIDSFYLHSLGAVSKYVDPGRAASQNYYGGLTLFNLSEDEKIFSLSSSKEELDFSAPKVITTISSIRNNDRPIQSVVPAFISTVIANKAFHSSPYIRQHLVSILEGAQTHGHLASDDSSKLPLKAFAFYPQRCLMFLVSLLSDFMLYRISRFIRDRSESLAVIVVWVSAWPCLLWMVRATKFTWQTFAIIGVFFSLFGTESFVINNSPSSTSPAIPFAPPGPSFLTHLVRFCSFASFFVIGLFTAPESFPAHLFSVMAYLLVILSRPKFFTLKTLIAAMLGWAVFATLFFAFILVDSVAYETMTIAFSKRDVANLATPMARLFKAVEKKKLSIRGFLTIVPVNVIKHGWRYFRRNPDYFPAIGQVFVSLPVLTGPIVIILVYDAFNGIKAMLNDLKREAQNVSSGAGLGASFKKKQKGEKRKVSAAEKLLEEAAYSFLDITQSTLLLCVGLDTMIPQSTTGLASILVALPLVVLLYAHRIIGPDSLKLATVAWFLFNPFAFGYFALIHHGGTIPACLALADSSHPIHSVIDPNSHIVFYRTPPVSEILLGSNPSNISIHWHPVSTKDEVDLFAHIHSSSSYSSSSSGKKSRYSRHYHESASSSSSSDSSSSNSFSTIPSTNPVSDTPVPMTHEHLIAHLDSLYSDSHNSERPVYFLSPAIHHISKRRESIQIVTIDNSEITKWLSSSSATQSSSSVFSFCNHISWHDRPSFSSFWKHITTTRALSDLVKLKNDVVNCWWDDASLVLYKYETRFELEDLHHIHVPHTQQEEPESEEESINLVDDDVDSGKKEEL